MKSTGECLGIAESFSQALLKAFKGVGMKTPKKGARVIVPVRDEDKADIVELAKMMVNMGIEILATAGTCAALTAVSYKHLI